MSPRPLFRPAGHALACLGAALALAVVLAGCGTGEADGIAAGGPPDREVSPTGRELLDVLASSRELTFNARYAARSPDPALGESTIEVWRKPPRVRQDALVHGAGGEKAQTATFLRPDGAFHCERDGNGPWSCASLPDAESAGFDDIVSSVRDEIAGAVVTRTDREVNKRNAHCYIVDPRRGAHSTLCVTDEGIPVLIRSGTLRLELLNLTNRVQERVFDLPAQPS